MPGSECRPSADARGCRDRLGRSRTGRNQRADTTGARPELRGDRPAAPVRLRGRRPVRGRLLRGRGLERPRVRALPGRLPAHALLLRPDHDQAGPERHPDRPGHDREARPGRLHHPLQAEPDARRRLGPAGRAGPPPPRHLALAARRLRQRAVLRLGRGEDDRALAEGLRHADQGDGPVAAPLHGPLGRPAADGGLHHLRHRLRPGQPRRARPAA